MKVLASCRACTIRHHPEAGLSHLSETPDLYLDNVPQKTQALLHLIQTLHITQTLSLGAHHLTAESPNHMTPPKTTVRIRQSGQSIPKSLSFALPIQNPHKILSTIPALLRSKKGIDET